MVYATFKALECEGVRVSIESAAAAASRCWRQALREPIDWVLLVLFAALQFVDITSTNRALALPGNHEGNPLIAAFQAHLGGAWWLPKLAAMVLVCLAAPLTQRRWPMAFAVSFYLLVVGGNLVAL